jgi:hypothetical protein
LPSPYAWEDSFSTPQARRERERLLKQFDNFTALVLLSLVTNEKAREAGLSN